MHARAGIVVTGTEVLTGRVSDRNGPWLAEQLRRLGCDVAHLLVVGDRPADLRQALEFLAGTGVALILTSGGLGPTADDLTARVVADFQGRPLALDAALERRIAGIVARLSAGRGWRLDPAATAAATHKQAMVPAGAFPIEPVGTAPGLVVPAADGRAGPPVLVLPGPPAELRGMWPAAAAHPVVTAALADAEELRERTVRLWNVPESELAAVLRAHPRLTADLEVSTCLRDGELEIVTRFRPGQQATYDELHAVLAAAYRQEAYSLDGRTVDELVADRLRAGGRTIAVAESCTGGLLAGRLSERPGSSAYLVGGVVAYANSVKQELVEVEPELLAAAGAVSAEVAEAMAAGVRSRFGADLGLGVTGIAGPDGGSEAKPVGLVHLCATDGARTLASRIVLPGSRADVRARAVTMALHLTRQLLDADG
ncbi:MAG TPA: competence/damage-inducible protein A [Jatrophihabitans sp.]|nr:competence/damage-inducible protein A [Jatrophihabitans sp.]